VHRELPISCLTILAVFSPHIAHADEGPRMKAVVAHEYGAPEVLKFEEVPRPGPKENEALVRAIASSVNPADPLTLSGKYAREFGTHLPLISGYDIAGVVEKNGRKRHETEGRRSSLWLPNFRRRLGGVCHGPGMGSRREARVSQLCGKPRRFRCAP
jgi:hypothetical protein